MAEDASEAPVRPGNSGRADYPRMLYQADGRMIIVHSPEEHEPLMHEGWDTVPAPIHQKPQVSSSADMVPDPYGIGPLIRRILNEVLNERNIGRRPGYGTDGRERPR